MTPNTSCSKDESIQIFDSRNNKSLKRLIGHLYGAIDIIMLTNGYLASSFELNNLPLGHNQGKLRTDSSWPHTKSELHH